VKEIGLSEIGKISRVFMHVSLLSNGLDRNAMMQNRSDSIT